MTLAPAAPWRGRVSVVVPTHDRPESLVRLLDALALPGRTPPHEVIIVADGCTPATSRAVADRAVPFPVRVLSQDPARGAAIARNLGAAEATGDLLLFIDDDIEPFGDVIGEHRAMHDGGHRVVIGAPRAPLSPTAGFRELAGWAWWEQQFDRMRRPGHRFGFDDVFTGLLSIPRELWTELGGFHDGLRCREDYELGLRLLRARADFAFTETGGGWHHENRRGERLVQRKREEGKADVAIARTHPWAFPALPLSRGTPDPRQSIVRRAAFDWPWLGDLCVNVAEGSLGLLESLRMRGTWQALHGGVMYYSYWRGAAAALQGWGELSRMADRALTERAPAYVEYAVDLQHDFTALRRVIDAVRPDVIRFRCGDVPLGTSRNAPGREAWRQAHLQAPDSELVEFLITARIVAELRDPATGARTAGHA